MQRHKNSIDQALKYALSAGCSPDASLQEKVKRMMQEEYDMMDGETEKQKGSFFRKSRFFIIAAVFVMTISMTAFAAWQYLSPSATAELFEYDLVAEAFESEGAIIINQTIREDGYQITLLGMVSGKELIESSHGGDIASIINDGQQTYVVVAVAREDGQMPDIGLGLSPLIRGQIPWRYNVHTLGGFRAETMMDNINYILFETDDLEKFADRGVYLGVYEEPVWGSVFQSEAFLYDEQSGAITLNPDYDGINALFDLPLDIAKADHEKAQRYLDSLYPDSTSSAENTQYRVSDGNGGPEEALPDFGPDGILIDESIRDDLRELDYEAYVVFMEKDLEQAREDIKNGTYSESSYQKDKQNHEYNLELIQNGGRVFLLEEGDSWSLFPIGPDESEEFDFVYEIGEDGLEIGIGAQQ